MLSSKNGLMILTPEGLPDDVVSFTTTRCSGNSEGAYASMNMGFHVGDDASAVSQNYTDLNTVYRTGEIQLLTQTHSNIVLDIDQIVSGAPEADGVFTRQSRLSTGIMTADCYNVQIIGKIGLANLHCGWKSIHSGIINNAIDLFEKYNDPVQCAVVGPGICYDCYEVNEALAKDFQGMVPATDVYKEVNGAYFLDLREILVQFLGFRGIRSIIALNNCSLCDNYLYSYRRDNGTTGRMLSVLMRQ